MTTYILVDASYYIFYRVYALYNWWKLTHDDFEEHGEQLHLNEEFVEKFKEMIIKKLIEMPKKLGIDKGDDIKYIIGKDCPRKHIWRNHIHPEYKAGRNNSGNYHINPGEFFKIVYNCNIFTEDNSIDVELISHPHLEADDCIAITTKYLHEKYSEDKKYIITSDMDYLQLKRENVYLYNLKYKELNTKKSSLGCPKKDLLYKIIYGDKSDNIRPVFRPQENVDSQFPLKRNMCGPKKTLYYVDNIKQLAEDLIKYNVFDVYKLNRQLIDFDMIPIEFQKELHNSIKDI